MLMFSYNSDSDLKDVKTNCLCISMSTFAIGICCLSFGMNISKILITGSLDIFNALLLIIWVLFILVIVGLNLYTVVRNLNMIYDKGMINGINESLKKEKEKSIVH